MNQENEAFSSPGRVTQSKEEITNKLKELLARELHMEPGKVNPNAPFSTYGVDSLKLYELIGEMESYLHTKIPEEALFLCNSIETFSEFLATNQHLEYGSD